MCGDNLLDKRQHVCVGQLALLAHDRTEPIPNNAVWRGVAYQ